MSTIQSRRGGGLNPPPSVMMPFIAFPKGRNRNGGNEAAMFLAKVFVWIVCLSFLGLILKLLGAVYNANCRLW